MSNCNLTGWCILNVNQDPRKTLCFKHRVITKTTRIPEEESKEPMIRCQDLWVQGTVLPLASQVTFAIHCSRSVSSPEQ